MVLLVLNTATPSEEVIAAKEAEVSGVTSTWVPPTETGLEHSSAIADSTAVAIGGGGASGGGGVERVFKAVGSFDKDAEAAAATGEHAPVLKVSSNEAQIHGDRGSARGVRAQSGRYVMCLVAARAPTYSTAILTG